MKAAALMAALLVGGAAIAQTTSADQGTSDDRTTSYGTTTPDEAEAQGAASQSQSTTSDETMSHEAMGHSTSAQGTTAATSNQPMPTPLAAGSQVVQPSNANPERDARGIAVISDPAMAPAGWNGSAGTAVGGPMEGAEASYPACSATITDNCLQTYERGRAR